jgi:hypothetical protein
VNLNFRNAPAFCASIDLASDRPKVDLSSLTFIEPSAVVYLGMFFRHFNASGKFFAVKFPVDRKVRKYLADQQFWERFNFRPDLVIREGRLRAFTSSTSPGDIIDIQKAPRVAERVAQEVYQILEWHPHVDRIGEIVSELVDNFAIHSKGPLAAFAMQWYPRRKRAILSIGDCGLGIRRTLSRNPKYAHLGGQPHSRAAVEAFKPLVSGLQLGGGTGLTEVRMAVTDLKGSMRLTTGDGYVEYFPRAARFGNLAFDLAGVQVEIDIPT